MTSRHVIFGTTAGDVKKERNKGLQAEYHGNLTRAYADVTPEEKERADHWYDEAALFGRSQAKKHNVSEQDSFSALALLNTHGSWQGSKTTHDKILAAKSRGERFPYTLASDKGEGGKGFDPFEKIHDILWKGADPEERAFNENSPKITPFFRGIQGDLDHLVIDVWGFRTTTAGRRDVLQGEERSAAVRAWQQFIGDVQKKEPHRRPAQIQASLWIRERERVQSHVLFKKPKVK